MKVKCKAAELLGKEVLDALLTLAIGVAPYDRVGRLCLAVTLAYG